MGDGAGGDQRAGVVNGSFIALYASAVASLAARVARSLATKWSQRGRRDGGEEAAALISVNVRMPGHPIDSVGRDELSARQG